MTSSIITIIWLSIFLLLPDSISALGLSANFVESTRIVAIGDLHGDLPTSKEVLKMAGLIDNEGHWAGNDTVFVQTGDVLDRGTDTIALYELLQQLRKEAPEYGGLVIPLLGNHEIMNLSGDWRYVTEEEMATFGGYHERIKAFQKNGFLGQYLTQLNLTTRVGRTAFVHGGIHPHFAQMGLDQINDHTHRDILTYMDSNGRRDPHHIFGDKGPTWYRGYALDEEPYICSIVDQALAHLEADRMVMGHSVQRDGKITTRCDGKIVLIDIGLSWVYGGHKAALEIVGDQLTAIYEHDRVSLTPHEPSASEHLEL